MADEATNNADALRYTGVATMFLNKAKLKAQQIITQAKSDSANTLAAAHTAAQATLATAHQQANRTLGRNLQKVFVYYGPLRGLAPDGSVNQPDVMLPPTAQILDLIVDSADQRLYYLGCDHYSNTEAPVNRQINYTTMAGYNSGTLLKSESRLNRLAFDAVNRQIFVSAYDGVYVVDLADNTFSRIVSLPNTMFWAIAVDPLNLKIYCTSKPVDVNYHYSLNIINYDGSIIKTVPLSDDMSARCLAVDSRSGYVLGSNPESGIWRAPLDLSEMTTFVSWKHVWTMLLDSSSQLLYWMRDDDLFRSTTDESLNAERVFGLDVGFISSFALVTLSDEVNRIMLAGKAKVAEAPAIAAEKVAAAHQRADQTRQDAHDKLEQAHADAADQIAAKQKEAEQKRQAAQADARATEARASQVVNDAKSKAAQTKQAAATKGQELIAQDKQTADNMKQVAQDSLDAQRLELQRS